MAQRRKHATPPRKAAVWMLCVALVMPGITPVAPAQAAEKADINVPPASLAAPFADPLLDLNATISALRVTVWEVEGTGNREQGTVGTAADPDSQLPTPDPVPPVRMMLLEGDASVRVGDYGFTGTSAVVRIEPEQTAAGRVWHVAAYFEDAKPMAGVGAVAAEGDRLLVTSSTSGKVSLENPGELRRVAAAPDSPLIDEAMRRLARHRTLQDQPGLLIPESDGVSDEAMARRERRRARIAEQQRLLYESAPGQAVASSDGGLLGGLQTNTDAEGGSFRGASEASGTPGSTPGTAPRQSILPVRGAVAYSMDSWSAKVGKEETAVSLVGDVRIVFESYDEGRVVTLKAERAVLFVSNDSEDADNADPASGGGVYSLGQLDAEGLRGVYLEDNAVISDGQYTVRAPRVYYDLARDRATLIDAVFYAYDAQRKVPLYVRADTVRQTSSSDFSAENARLTTSEFAVPHFSIGAREMTFSQYRVSDDRTGVLFTAEDVTLNLSDQPFFYWPYIAAYGRDTPLRSLDAGFESNNGFQVRTEWDMFAMLGKIRPENSDWRANFDHLGDHGPGIGTSGGYSGRDNLGQFEGYLLPDDDGEDNFGGRTVQHDDDTRGFALARHRMYLPNRFELSLEGAYVSDPTFLEEFYPDETLAKPYETSAYLKRQEANTSFDLLASTSLADGDFIEQLDVLQSQGYRVEKYPELGYRVIGGDLFDGRVSWFGQTTLAQMRIASGDDTPGDRGFDAAQSADLFGIAPTTSFDDRLDGLGIPTRSVRRLDTRQELAMPLASGPIDITPYAVGRVTAYDDDFAEFNGGNDDNARLWGELGLRVGTEFHGENADFRSSILDVNGIRHIVEPSATFFVNGSTLDSEDLPVYDPDVESLSDGSGVRLGVTQTWQTRRGGPGRQRTVDWITWSNDVVLKADDADVDEPLARFYDYRPEYSVGGDHYHTELLWMVTDTLGVAGELTHSFEDDRVAQWRVGATLDHTPRLTSFLAYGEVDALDSQLLTYGFNYQLTTKYRVGFAQTLDFSGSKSRSIDITLDRKIPRWTLRIKAGYDEIDDESRIGVTLLPDGRATRNRVPGLALQ